MKKIYARELVSYYLSIGTGKFIFGDNNFLGTEKISKMEPLILLIILEKKLVNRLFMEKFIKNIKINANGYPSLILMNIY